MLSVPFSSDGDVLLHQITKQGNPKISSEQHSMIASHGEISDPPNDAIKIDETFYQNITPLIRRIVRARRHPKVEQEDCIQGVWCDLLYLLPKFRFDPMRGQPQSWFFIVIRRLVIAQERRAHRDRARGWRTEIEANLPSRDLEPSTAYANQQSRDLVWVALNELKDQVSSQSYRVFYLRAIEEQPAREVARCLGLSARQVHDCHYRMLGKFSAILTRLFSDHSSNGKEGRTPRVRRSAPSDERGIEVSHFP